MAWTTPLTAVANATFTAAQYNTHARDNFNEMEAAKATGAWSASGSYADCMFHATGANAIALRQWRSNIVQKTGQGESSTSTSYTDVRTLGPSVTVTTGVQALVFFGAILGNSSANAAAYASVAVSGASTVAADDDWALEMDGHTAYAGSNDDNALRRSQWKLFTGLTVGSNTFTMKYRVASGTGRFNYRHIAVWAM